METKEKKQSWWEKLFKRTEQPEVKMEVIEPTELDWAKIQLQDNLEFLRDSTVLYDKDFVKNLENIFSLYQKERSLFKGEELQALDKTVEAGFKNFREEVLAYTRYHSQNPEMKAYISDLPLDLPPEKDKEIANRYDTAHFIVILEDQATSLLSQPSEYDIAYNDLYSGWDHQKQIEKGWEKLSEYGKKEINLKTIGDSLRGIYEHAFGKNHDGTFVRESKSIQTSIGELETQVQVTRKETMEHLRGVFEKALKIRPDLIHEYTREENKFLFTELAINPTKASRILLASNLENDRSKGEGEKLTHIQRIWTHEQKEPVNEFQFVYDKESMRLKLGEKFFDVNEEQQIDIPPDKSLTISIYSEGNKEFPILQLNNITHINWPSAQDQLAGVGAYFQSSLREVNHIDIPTTAIGSIVTLEIGGPVKESFSEDLRPSASKNLNAKIWHGIPEKDIGLEYSPDNFF
jgi:hypothetical protein